MSTVSLLSSGLKAAVLRMSCSSSEEPGIIVLTFQLPSRSAGYFFGLLLVLLGTWVVVQQFRSGASTLSSLHPKEHIARAGSSPYWLGVAQLRRAVADQWSYDDSSHRRRQPVVSISTSIEN